MAHPYGTDWTRHIWKILMVGGIFALLGIVLPSCAILESSATLFMWYFGYWMMLEPMADSGGASDFFVDPYDNKYMTIGIATIIVLIIALILIIASSNNIKYDKNKRASAGLGLFGGILAIIGPVIYYFYLKEEFSGFWMAFDESFGFYFPIIGGILAIIGAIAAGYAYTLERKAPLKPTLDTGITPQVTAPSTQEGKRFCSNCGAELFGPFCRECGQKVE